MMTPQQKGLAWTAAMALFMQSLDATILNTALPVMSASLHESPLQMELAIISYALTVAALIPLSGWRWRYSCSVRWPAPCRPRWIGWWPRGYCRALAAR